MSKFLLILFLMFIASGVFAGYAYFSSNAQNDQSKKTIKQEIVRTQKDIAKFPDSPTQGQKMFKIRSGEVKYIATKSDSDGSSSKIIGKTDDVFGYALKIDSENKLSGLIYIDLRDLNSNNLARDSIITASLSSKDVIIEIDTNENIDFSEPNIDKTISAKLKLNNVSKDIPITLKGSINPGNFTLTTGGNINLEDFNIDLSRENITDINNNVQIEIVASGSVIEP